MKAKITKIFDLFLHVMSQNGFIFDPGHIGIFHQKMFAFGYLHLVHFT